MKTFRFSVCGAFIGEQLLASKSHKSCGICSAREIPQQMLARSHHTIRVAQLTIRRRDYSSNCVRLKTLVFVFFGGGSGFPFFFSFSFPVFQ